MNQTINITFKNGKRWNIHRSVLDSLSKKSEEELKAFFGRFWAWFEECEKDVLISLIKMEKEGIAINPIVNLEYNR